MTDPRNDLLSEILNTVQDGFLENIVVGKHWTAVSLFVENMRTCGLASTIGASSWDGHVNAVSGRDLHISAKYLASKLSKHDAALSSIAGATLNALLQYMFIKNLVEKTLPFNVLDSNAEDLILQHGKNCRVAVIGHFPFIERIRSKVGHLDVLENNPQPGDLPAETASIVLPRADVVAITAMAWINGTLQSLLSYCSKSALVLVLGASTPLSPVLFSYGIHYLCGALVKNIDPVMQAVAAGAVYRQIIPAGLELISVFPINSDRQEYFCHE